RSTSDVQRFGGQVVAVLVALKAERSGDKQIGIRIAGAAEHIDQQSVAGDFWAIEIEDVIERVRRQVGIGNGGVRYVVDEVQIWIGRGIDLTDSVKRVDLSIHVTINVDFRAGNVVGAGERRKIAE